MSIRWWTCRAVDIGHWIPGRFLALMSRAANSALGVSSTVQTGSFCGEVKVAWSCLTLCNPWTTACQAPPLPGILQARILEGVAIPFSRGSSQLRERTQVSCIAGGFFPIWVTREGLEKSFASVFISFPDKDNFQSTAEYYLTETLPNLCLVFSYANEKTLFETSMFSVCLRIRYWF